jgi:hypothetical protein
VGSLEQGDCSISSLALSSGTLRPGSFLAEVRAGAKGPSCQSNDRALQSKGEGYLAQSSELAIDSYDCIGRCDYGQVSGVSYSCGYDYVHPRIRFGGIEPGDDSNRCAAGTFGAFARCFHDSSQASADEKRSGAGYPFAHCLGERKHIFVGMLASANGDR